MKPASRDFTVTQCRGIRLDRVPGNVNEIYIVYYNMYLAAILLALRVHIKIV